MERPRQTGRRLAITEMVRNFRITKIGLDPEQPLVRSLEPQKLQIGNQTEIKFSKKSPQVLDLFKKVKERSMRTRCTGNANDEQHTENRCPSKKCRVRGMKRVEIKSVDHNQVPKKRDIFKIKPITGKKKIA